MNASHAQNDAAFVCVLDCVGEQITQNAFQQYRITVDSNIAAIETNSQTFFLCQGDELASQTVEYRSNAKTFQMRHHLDDDSFNVLRISINKLGGYKYHRPVSDVMH